MVPTPALRYLVSSAGVCCSDPPPVLRRSSAGTGGSSTFCRSLLNMPRSLSVQSSHQKTNLLTRRAIGPLNVYCTSPFGADSQLTHAPPIAAQTAATRQVTMAAATPMKEVSNFQAAHHPRQPKKAPIKAPSIVIIWSFFICFPFLFVNSEPPELLCW